MVLASVSLASDAASLDVLRDAFGDVRTIRHSKGHMTQQLLPTQPPASGLPALPEPVGRLAAAAAAAAAAASVPETAGKVTATSQAAAAGGEKAAAAQPRGGERRRTQSGILGQARNATPVTGGGGSGESRTRSGSQNAMLPDFACQEGQVACPTPNRKNVRQCIAIQSLCNGNTDCYGEEDEDPVMCKFYQQIYVDLNAKIKKISTQLQELTHYVNEHRHDAEGHVVRPTV